MCMDEIGYAHQVGRKPLPTESGERLQKYAVKLFPHQWQWLLDQGNASEWIREEIAKRQKRESLRRLRTK